ncbi:MAG: PTS sugar transporter subunit IIA [Luteolibacter sp.]|uniref:PTS sugar transporter subunit IIA n=1 Tax=Luteolibacter sp. TaxID=1962973 RepID=UPI003265DFE6
MSLPELTLNVPPLLDLDVTTENDAIRRTAGLLGNCAEVSNFPGFLDAVFDRQRINPPLLGNGVALPHARTSLVSEIVCVAARCAAPVPFGSEGKPVRLIFLFGIPPHRIAEYLALTAALVKRLRNPETIEGLLAAESADDFLRWLE